jgi:general secretion pathway protein F/type IV pilus assembly protein PilC
MPEFHYKARTAAGQDVAGTMTATNKREILCALGERSLFPLHVECAEAPKVKQGTRRRIKPHLVATNLSQLADLLNNGVPLLAALQILTEQASSAALRDVFTEVHDSVAEGSSLDEAMARYPDVFSELTVNMIRAGSEGAFLEAALKRTADFLELQRQLRGKVTGAMTYPAFLAGAGVIVVVVLLVFFVPKFAELFNRLQRQGGGLPMPTIMLLAISDFLKRYGVLVAAALVGLVFWARRALATPRGRFLADRWKLKLPVFGAIFLSSALSRFCRVLGTLLRNGVPLLKALEISSDSAGNRILAQAIRDSAENVSSGDTLAKPLADCGLVPRSVMAMISIAEESNNLDEVLIHIADGLDQETARQLDVMVRLIEPLLLVVMGMLIMFVLVALLMPVFDMSAAIG